MRLFWDNPEKTRVCVDDGRTVVSVSTIDDNPTWAKISKQVKRRKLIIAEHVIVKNDPPLPSFSVQELRAASYPSLSDMADALYWRERGDPEKYNQWLAACDAVKTALPKPKEQA